MSDVTLRLHNYWRSSASYRVRIALGLKGLAYEYVTVDIHGRASEQLTVGYKAKNPMGQVPTLEIVEADGKSTLLQQSLPIMEYLEERWPEPALLPADRTLRARARALAEIVNSGIQPLQNLSTTNKVKALGGDDRAWVQGFIADGLLAMDKLAWETAGRFSVGDTPSIADCCLVPQIYSASRFGVPPEQFPLLIQIWRACSELPAFADAHPDRQPDAERH